ncbi:MAG TPA: alkaline phosphatase D family protein, partial [Gemmatimonadales bacterium]|nr:alkaline phosphatase D family protein [Gemmatimonadales bacterium]
SRLAAMSAIAPAGLRFAPSPRFQDDPFELGVASGDPLPDGAVIWTRLAPRPMEPEGGMPGIRTTVTWEVARDEGFSNVVQTGRVTAAPELAYSIHVDVRGLEPARWYFYRFTAGDAVSPVGRLRTTPAPGVIIPLNLAVASCQHYEQGYWTAYEHMVREELDLVAHLGDYVYEYGAYEDRVRNHAGLEIRTLEDYRRRYALYKMDPLLQAVHLRCPWIVTWDDHEVDNNYAGLTGENLMESDEQMHVRRAAAYQAWWEHMPVRVPRARSWADLNIARRMQWGGLAQFHVLDTRQYRSDQACGDGLRPVPCGDWNEPSRTMLGEVQERWLADGLTSSDARWQVLAQQVMVAPFDNVPGEVRGVSMDQWSGYPAARERMMRAVADSAPNRTVVLTGDIHSNWVNELHVPHTPVEGAGVAAEFVATSISSGGDGQDAWGGVNDNTLGENPQVKWHSARRGYIYCEVTPQAWTSTYREVPYVSRPGAPVRSASRWRVENGRPGIVAV